jgi:hypothetical protein
VQNENCRAGAEVTIYRYVPVVGERVSAFLAKLEAAPIGVLTYGLAFHTEYTRVLR